MKPTLSILDPSFIYRNAVHTDVRETFARVRREMDAGKALGIVSVELAPLRKNVTLIKRGKQ